MSDKCGPSPIIHLTAFRSVRRDRVEVAGDLAHPACIPHDVDDPRRQAGGRDRAKSEPTMASDPASRLGSRWDELEPLDHDVLDQALRQGWLTVDRRLASLPERRRATRLDTLCDRGLLWRVLEARPEASGRAIFAITEWGQIVWKQQRVRADREALRRWA